MSVAQQTLKLLPTLLTLLAQLVGGPPLLQVFAQPLIVVSNRAEPLVATEGKESIQVVGDYWLGKGRRTAGSAGQVLEPLKKSRDLGALLSRLVLDAGCSEQTAQLEPLFHRRRLVLLVERCPADLVGGQLLRAGEVLAVLGSSDVACGNERQQRAVNRVLRPAVPAARELVIQLGALGAAGADDREHFFAHRMRRRLSAVAHCREGVGGAVASLHYHLVPVRVVTHGELREQADERLLRRRAHAFVKRRDRELADAAHEHSRSPG